MIAISDGAAQLSTAVTVGKPGTAQSVVTNSGVMVKTGASKSPTLTVWVADVEFPDGSTAVQVRIRL